MSICRIFPGRADSPGEVRNLIRYLVNPTKNIWMGEGSADMPGRLKGWMLPDDPLNLDAVFYAFMAPHRAYADVRIGHRLYYHLLLDFGGLLTPEQAIDVGWQAAAWFQRFWVQYMQGVHTIKFGRGSNNQPLFWPHVHWLVSTRMLDGSGIKFHFDKAKLRSLKLYVNEVLAAHNLPAIVMRKDIDDGRKIDSSGSPSCYRKQNKS